MIPKICALGLLLTFVAVLLSEFGYKNKRLFSVLAVILLLSILGGEISTAMSGMLDISQITGITDTAKCAFKIIGIGYVFGIASDIAKELSEPAIANAVTVGGRIEILLIAMPYFVEIVKLGVELIK